MKPTRLFLGALVLIAACGLGARCYPPGTRVVIFIEGVYTSYDPAKSASDDFVKLKQAFGRLIRRADDRGVFVLLDRQMPSRLLGAFPAEIAAERIGLADAIEKTRSFLAPYQTPR